MENLNAEHVKKWLEQLSLEPCMTGVTIKGHSVVHLLIDSLAIINSQEQRIKELTEENEGLIANNKILVNNNADLEFELALTYDCLEDAKADTVRKMQERWHEQFHDRAAYTRSYVHDTIDQIAKEMLEGKDETTHSI